MLLTTTIAQNVLPPIDPSDLGGRGFSTLGELVNLALQDFVLPILTALAILYLIWAGYQFITSGGDPAVAQKARASLTYAIIGVILVLVSYGLVNLLNILSERAQQR